MSEDGKFQPPPRAPAAFAKGPVGGPVGGPVKGPVKRPANGPVRGPVFARQVGSFLPRVARAVFEAHGFPSAHVLSEWPAIAGPDLAGFTTPERLIWPHRTSHAMREDRTNARQSARRPAGATLLLRVQGPRALEVQHGAQQIIERVNGYFGYRAVADLRIVQGPVAAKRAPRPALPREAAPDETGLDRITDDRLKNALARLAAQVE